MSDSLQPYGQQPTRLLCPQDSLGKNTGVGCHFLLHTVISLSLIFLMFMAFLWSAFSSFFLHQNLILNTPEPTPCWAFSFSWVLNIPSDVTFPSTVCCQAQSLLPLPFHSLKAILYLEIMFMQLLCSLHITVFVLRLTLGGRDNQFCLRSR